MKKPVEDLVKSVAEIDAAEEQIVELSKRIEFYLTEYSVELLSNKMKSGDFVIPEYQREFTWDPQRQSRFIESLLLGLPIPFLFFGNDRMANLKLLTVHNDYARFRALLALSFDCQSLRV